MYLVCKLLGAVLIIIASATVGRYASKKLEKRVCFLADVQQGILTLAREMDYALTPMPQAFAVAAQTARSARFLFGSAAEILSSQRGVSAEEAWKEAMQQVTMPLKAEEVQVLESFATGLGLSDKANQLKKLELSRLRLQALETTAKEEYQKMAKVWRSLGLTFGFAVVLICF